MAQDRSVRSEDDLVLESNYDGDATGGDIVLKTAGVERARIKGTGTGTVIGSSTFQAAVAAPAYSASITPNAAAAPWQTITVTNGVALTVNAPTNPPDSSHTAELTIEISNTSGGAMGAITWNAVFKLAGGAFTNPATGTKRFIRFEWNGVAWVETCRAAADY